MREPSTDFKWVQFPERPFVKYDEVINSEWEIVSTNNLCSPQEYCRLLIEKIKELDFTELDQFLNYQCKQLRDPYKWLHSLESLLEQNIISLKREGLSNYFLAIERCRVTVNVAVSTNLEQSIIHFYHRYYNIQNVKNRVEKLPTYKDKISFLLEQKTIYLQNKPSIVPPHITPFDEQIELEIKKWKELQMLTQEQEQLPSTYRIPTTLSVSELAYFFRALSDCGYISESNKTKLSKFLADNFTAKQQTEPSWKSIKNQMSMASISTIRNVREKLAILFNYAKKNEKN